MMSCLKPLLIHLLCFIALTRCKQEQLPEVKIEYISKPDDCSEFVEFGDTVAVHYTAYVGADSTKMLETSRGDEANPPQPFVVGNYGRAVGWENAMVGMCVGEVRKMTIPPHLAFGDGGKEPYIPGGSTMVFETELIELRKIPLLTKITWYIQNLSVPVLFLAFGVYLFRKVWSSSHKKPSKEEKRQKKRKTKST